MWRAATRPETSQRPEKVKSRGRSCWHMFVRVKPWRGPALELELELELELAPELALEPELTPALALALALVLRLELEPAPKH